MLRLKDTRIFHEYSEKAQLQILNFNKQYLHNLNSGCCRIRISAYTSLCVPPQQKSVAEKNKYRLRQKHHSHIYFQEIPPRETLVAMMIPSSKCLTIKWGVFLGGLRGSYFWRTLYITASIKKSMCRFQQSECSPEWYETATTIDSCSVPRPV